MKVHKAKTKEEIDLLWEALNCNSVRRVGYGAGDSEWIPVNVERLGAAMKIVEKYKSSKNTKENNNGIRIRKR